VTQDRKKSRWFVIFIALLVIAAAVYVLIVYLSPGFVTIPFTNLTSDAITKKVQTSKAGQYGDRLFVPQINVDVAIVDGTASDALTQGAWHRNSDLGSPAKGGNFALGGIKFVMDTTPQWTRAKSPFYNLGKVNEGDELTVDYKGTRYTYKVDKKYMVKDADASVEHKSETPKLTLYPVNSKGTVVAGTALEASLLNPPKQEQAASFGNTLESGITEN
jgi:LPXTG-site transpeptidase (sortase) family protein